MQMHGNNRVCIGDYPGGENTLSLSDWVDRKPYNGVVMRKAGRAESALVK